MHARVHLVPLVEHHLLVVRRSGDGHREERHALVILLVERGYVVARHENMEVRVRLVITRFKCAVEVPRDTFPVAGGSLTA